MVKGQTQAVTAILITGITVGAISTVYVWGTPVLEKRQGQANVQAMDSTVLDMYDEMVALAGGGSGPSTNIELDFSDQDAEIEHVWVEPDKDAINITLRVSSSLPYPDEKWTLLRGDSLQNISIGSGMYGQKGTDLPGVVMVRPSGGSGSRFLTYRIEFRNLYVDTPTGERLEKIDLTAPGAREGAGETTVRVTNERTEQDLGQDGVELPSGEKIDRTRTILRVSIQ